MNILSEARKVFDTEILALEKTRDNLDETIIKIINLIVSCKGKVIVTGMGKPGHIATKIAATFSSLGTPSFCLHPAEAMHGDLGMISSDDIVLAISYSGESDEIVRILPNIKLIGAKIIALTGNKDSTLAKAADITQVLPKFKEACYLGLAPTSSTTAELCFGDALAVVASGIYGFKDADFGKFHPAGSLGKKLILKVSDLMAKENENAVVHTGVPLRDAIIELGQKGLGVVSVVDDSKKLIGIVTDGDLRRLLLKGADVYSLSVQDAMTKNPVSIQPEKLAIEALSIMRDKNISCMPVISDNMLVGTIRLQNIIGAGIVG